LAGGDVPDWRVWAGYMEECTRFTIYYPLCGGACECVTACPRGWRIWRLAAMRIGGKVLYRPVLIDPGNCIGCMNCVRHCPTSALRPKGEAPRSRAGWILGAAARLLSLLLRPRLLRHLARREHWELARAANTGEGLAEEYLWRGGPPGCRGGGEEAASDRH